LLECSLPVGPELKVLFEFPNGVVLAANPIADEVKSPGDVEEGAVPVLVV
jgi:hypothetical protein